MIEFRLTGKCKAITKDMRISNKAYALFNINDNYIELFAYSKDGEEALYFEVIEYLYQEDKDDELNIFITLSTTHEIKDAIDHWELEKYLNMEINIDDVFL
jgi:hypothetical protein